MPLIVAHGQLKLVMEQVLLAVCIVILTASAAESTSETLAFEIQAGSYAGFFDPFWTSMYEDHETTIGNSYHTFCLLGDIYGLIQNNFLIQNYPATHTSSIMFSKTLIYPQRREQRLHVL